MVYVRRRYYFWLLKAYVKKWRKTILLSVFLGALVFFGFFLALGYITSSVFKDKTQKIGYAGSYTLATLPFEILSDVSYGLTTVEKDGSIKPAAADYKITNDGKTITFSLKKNLSFSNGDEFQADDVTYTFKDVKKVVKDPYTIEYQLSNPYAPFLSVMNKPIIQGDHGLSQFEISKTERNGGFLKTLTLLNKSTGDKKIIYFYPTQDALRSAFMLGEVDRIEKLAADTTPQETFKDWKNVEVARRVDYNILIAAFFNNLDPVLAQKKVRQALVYALPETFKEGERSYSFLPTHSMYYTESPNEGVLDLGLAQELLDSSNEKKLELTITTTNELVETAKEVAKAWERLGIKSKIITSQEIPPDYQVLIYPMTLPLDPDMYSVWHSTQPHNITHYKNVRIDKLLEDGRTTMNTTDRISIYADLQKYLLDDAPAAFLYFPYEYTVNRKI
ncbi:MAG: ABC transporter substrate-binding protein [Candidatus Levybacteria bacterium]|nr:ABC transporter substrate-binding protein [Candidatus Levybacteria bacterium]